MRSTEQERLALLRSQRIDVVTAMTVAGVINLSMLVVAAQVLSTRPAPVDTIEEALRRPGDQPSARPPRCCSRWRCSRPGFAASGVGTFSGQVVMQGFLRRRVPLVVRRLVTLAPALVVIGSRRRPDAGTGDLPGGAVLRDPVRADPARPADAADATSWVRWSTAGPPRWPPTVVATVICCLNVTLIALTVGG